MNKNIVRLFESQVQNKPTTDAIVSPTRTLSYALLNAEANRLLDRMYVYTQNSLETCFVYTKSSVTAIISMVAIFKSKKIYIPINTDFHAATIIEILDLFRYPNIKEMSEYWKNVQPEGTKVHEDLDEPLDIFDQGMDLFNE